MVVSQLVNHYETLNHDVNNPPSLTEISKNPVKVHFHPAESSTPNSQPSLSVVDSDEEEAGSVNNEPLLDEVDIFGCCSETEAEFEPTDFEIISTATRMSVMSAIKPITVISRPDSEKSNSEPPSPVQSTHAINSDIEVTETRRRSSSGVDSKDSCGNSSSSSLPCLSRSSSVTSESTPVTPKREIPTFTFTSAETFESLQPPHLDIGEPICEERTGFSTPTASPESKGKERDVSNEAFPTFAPPILYTEESIQAAVALQLQAGFRYSLAERQFHNQMSLGYMPTIHENCQTLPFLNEDPMAKTSRQRPVSSGAPLSNPAGLLPRIPQQHPVEKVKVDGSRPSSIKSDDSASTAKTKTNSKSIKKMPSAIFKGIKRYYVPEVS